MFLDTVALNLRKTFYQSELPSLGSRKIKLQKLKTIIKKHERLLVQALAHDLNKSEFESYSTEIGFVLEELSYILKHIDAFAAPKKVSTPLTLFPGKSIIYPEPYGVVLIISPWNYPFQLCLVPLIGAIAAGNRVVVKPSEFSPKTSEAIKIILEECFDSNEVVVAVGGVEETQNLLQQKFDYIFFTGSTMVGKIVMKAAAEHLTPVTLELGGKSPLLIERSANLDLAAKRCVWGKFLNAGQTCVAPDYVLIPEELRDDFIEKMQKHVKAFYGSDPKSSPDYPRIVNEKHFDRLMLLIEEKNIAFGGETSRNEKYLAPTVLKNVLWDDKIMQDEIFGPILPVLTYRNLEEAIGTINSSPKPLAFYLFSNDQSKKKEIIARIPFGGGCVNDTIVHLANPDLPFGGVGPSGYGSYHGRKTFECFSHYKSVYEQNTRVDIPLRYPPYDGKLSWIKFLFR